MAVPPSIAYRLSGMRLGSTALLSTSPALSGAADKATAAGMARGDDRERPCARKPALCPSRRRPCVFREWCAIAVTTRFLSVESQAFLGGFAGGGRFGGLYGSRGVPGKSVRRSGPGFGWLGRYGSCGAPGRSSSSFRTELRYIVAL